MRAARLAASSAWDGAASDKNACLQTAAITSCHGGHSKARFGAWSPTTFRDGVAIMRGASTIVYIDRMTVVDVPTRHADELSAERPPSGTFGGGSTNVD